MYFTIFCFLNCIKDVVKEAMVPTVQSPVDRAHVDGTLATLHPGTVWGNLGAWRDILALPVTKVRE